MHIKLVWQLLTAYYKFCSAKLWRTLHPEMKKMADILKIKHVTNRTSQKAISIIRDSWKSVIQIAQTVWSCKKFFKMNVWKLWLRKQQKHLRNGSADCISNPFYFLELIVITTCTILFLMVSVIPASQSLSVVKRCLSESADRFSNTVKKKTSNLLGVWVGVGWGIEGK